MEATAANTTIYLTIVDAIIDLQTRAIYSIFPHCATSCSVPNKNAF